MKAGWKILIVLFAVVLAGVALWAVLLKQDVTPGPAREKVTARFSGFEGRGHLF